MASRRSLAAALLCAACLSPLTVLASRTEYGITLGKTTLRELRQKFPRARLVGENYYSSGAMLRIDGRTLASGSALYALTAICDRSGIVIAMQAVYDARAINSVHEYFQSRYKVKSVQSPFIGDTVVEYADGTNEIELRAPEMDPRLTVTFTSREFRRLMLLKKSLERLPQDERQNNVI
jgi:hypothetical protein